MSIRRTLRKYMYLSHLWIGLILGIYFSLLGLTGSSLIFKNEINRFVEPRLYYVAAGTRRISLDAIAQTFLDATPGAKISSLILPEKPDESLTINYRSIKPNVPGGKRHDWRQCFINPYSGTILGDEIGGGEFFHTIRNLHARLLLEDVGLDINRYGVLFIIVLLISGIYLWFPSIKHFSHQLKQRITIKLDGKFKRVVYDTHNAVGFYSSIALITLATTAVTALWYDQSVAVVSFLTHSQMEPEKKSASTRSFSYEQVFQQAKDMVPGYSPAIISDDARVYMQPIDNHYIFPRMITINFYPRTTQNISIERPEDKPLAQQIMSWTMPVHFGQFGYQFAYYPVKCLWVLIGFCPVALCITGFLMYFNKQKSAKVQSSSPSLVATTLIAEKSPQT